MERNAYRQKQLVGALIEQAEIGEGGGGVKGSNFVAIDIQSECLFCVYPKII